MHLSPSFRGVVLSLIFAGANALSFNAQSQYAAAGGQAPLPGTLPGSQAHPYASLSGSGGFLVWDDNTADKDGLGIRASALDRNLSPVGAPFRVNKSGARDQEHPCVALPPNGGAVFVWQSGRAGFQRVFARFLSSSNTWLNTDVLVSTNKNAQSAPAITVLDNGNIAIVWTSVNQAGTGSMKDVYGQIFTPGGQKVGAQFLVNQFTTYNQRSPAVTALQNGRFLVTWISEQQRIGGSDSPGAQFAFTNNFGARVVIPVIASVDINARVFGNDGTATGPEFLVNTGQETCANPSVAAGSDGGFIVAWSQRSLSSLTQSWDIFARAYSSVGLSGPSRPINTFLEGSQYAPQVRCNGSDYLVIWTSTGQDSSGPAVYGQFLAADSSPVGGEFKLNTLAIGGRIEPLPCLAADGAGRFLACWSVFAGFGADVDLAARLYASSNFVASASSLYAPPPAETFDDSNGDPNVPPLLEPPPVVSNPATNAFVFAKASYSGFFYDITNGVSPSNSGMFTLSSTAAGVASARFNLGGKNYSLSTRLSSKGFASGTISRGALHALNVQLLVDSSGSVQGSITDGRWKASITGIRLISSATKYLARPFVGKYTIDIPGIPQEDSPGGDGFGTVKVDVNGKVQFTASLPDGTKVSQSSALSESALWPLYASGYQGLGEIMGWMQFTNDALGGQLIWVKQPGSTAKMYPAGFTNQVDAFGSLYKAPLKGQRAIALNDGLGNLALTGGGMASILNSAISVDSNNKVSSGNNSSLKFTISPSTGLFKGSINNPETGKVFAFQGALFPDRNVALGYFLGPGGAGQISVEPAP